MENKKNTYENDRITNRILVAFLAAFVGVMLLMLVYRFVSEAQTAVATLNTLDVLGYIFLGLFFAGAVLEILRRFGVIKRPAGLLKGLNIAVFSAFVFLSCFLITHYNFMTVIRFLYALVPSLAVLYLIYLVYPREFYIVCLYTAPLVLLLWLLGRISVAGAAHTVGLILLCAAAAAYAVSAFFFARSADRKPGRLLLLLRLKGGLPALTFTAVLLFAVAAVSLFLSPAVLPYLAYALLGYLFAMAVYFTVKLM